MLFKPVRRNIRLMYAITFATGFAFFYPFLAVYMQGQLGSVFHVTIVYAVITAGTAILEIPTGILADKIGRCRTLILASCIDILAVLFLAVGTSLVHFLFYAVAVASTSALRSGTSDALIYDTLVEDKQEALYQRTIGIIGVVSTMAAAAAGLLGGIVAQVSPRFAVFLTLIPFSLGTVASFLLREPTYHGKERIKVMTHAKEAMFSIVRSRALLLLAAVYVLFDAVAEPMYQLFQIFYQANGIPLGLFGLIFCFSMLLRSVGSFAAHIVSRHFGNIATVILSILGIIVFTLAATYSHGWLAVGLVLLFYVFFGIIHPVLSDMTNGVIPSARRATTLSMINFMSAIGLTASVPFLGFVADLWGIRNAYRFFILLLFLLLILASLLQEKHSTQE